MDPKAIVKQHVLTELLHETDPSLLDDEAPLIEGGIIDSMNLMRLVAFMEEKFGFKVGEEELDSDNFRTVNALADFVRRKTGA